MEEDHDYYSLGSEMANQINIDGQGLSNDNRDLLDSASQN